MLGVEFIVSFVCVCVCVWRRGGDTYHGLKMVCMSSYIISFANIFIGYWVNLPPASLFILSLARYIILDDSINHIGSSGLFCCLTK